jgi:biotin carboxylase
MRPHADWRRLPRNQADYQLMAARMPMVQDAAQIEVYESKSEQFRRWARFMPPTWRFADQDAALQFLAAHGGWPLVSKADVGASSVNVRILEHRAAAEAHVREIFGPGIAVNHGAERAPKTLQRDYVLLQQFIPHQITWRVNVIGNARAIFQRYCYPDRPVAQTGNVEPVMQLSEQHEDLLRYANHVVESIGSRWCALDILQDTDGQWKLLETSLAWPWPSPGRCNEAPIFGSSHPWIRIWDVMFEQVAAGAFWPAPAAASSSSTSAPTC